MDTKDTLRDAKTNTKAAVREVDGHQLGDDLANAGDRIRDGLGKVGDKAREEMDKLHRDANARVDDAPDRR